MSSSITLLHPTPLISIYWLTSNLYPILTHQFLAQFRRPLLYVDITFVQILFTALLSQLYLYLYSNSSTRTFTPPTKPRLSQTIPLLQYSVLLLTNLSFYHLGAAETLLWRLLQPVSAAFLSAFFLHETVTHVSLLGLFLTVLGVYHFSSDFTLFKFAPVILATILVSIRDVCIKVINNRDITPPRGDPDEEHKKTAETTCSMAMFNWLLLRALPVAFLLYVWKVFRYGFHAPVITSLIRSASMLACYHVASIALIPRIDTFTHSVVGTLKRFAAILFALLVFSVPLTYASFEGIGLAFAGFVLYLIGQDRKKLSATPVVLGVFSGILVLAAFVFGGGLEMTDVPQVELDVTKFGPVSANVTEKVEVTESLERVNENPLSDSKYMVIGLNDYQSAWKSVVYAGYEQAVNHDVGNVGNLVWKFATYERLTDFGGVTMCESDDITTCAEMARSQWMHPLVVKPVANLLDPDNQNVFNGVDNSIRKNGLRIMNIGLGVHIPFRRNSADPEFNSSAKITTSSSDYQHPENTKDYLRAMSESGGELFLRGDFSLNVTRVGGFPRGYSVGCPSLFMNTDVYLGKTLEAKYNEIGMRQGDKSLKIAVNLKRKCSGIEKQIIHFRDNYPNSRFYAQGPGDMKLLNLLKVPYERTRLFSNVEDWMEDLKEMEVSYGLRIHGNMIALAAGLPVVVVASDWRVLELVQRMKLPYLSSYDAVFEEVVDVAEMVGKMGRFNGVEFDRNRCEIAKVYIEVFGRYGIGVRKHVQEIAQLC